MGEEGRAGKVCGFFSSLNLGSFENSMNLVTSKRTCITDALRRGTLSEGYREQNKYFHNLIEEYNAASLALS